MAATRAVSCPQRESHAPQAAAVFPNRLFHGMGQAPLPGHLAGSRLGLPSIFRYRAVSVLLWAACFFTSFESSAWIVCESRSQPLLLAACLPGARGLAGAGTAGPWELSATRRALAKWGLLSASSEEARR